MTTQTNPEIRIAHPNSLFIGGVWIDQIGSLATVAPFVIGGGLAPSRITTSASIPSCHSGASNNPASVERGVPRASRAIPN
jgi:hypothetical protein